MFRQGIYNILGTSTSTNVAANELFEEIIFQNDVSAYAAADALVDALVIMLFHQQDNVLATVPRHQIRTMVEEAVEAGV